MITKELLDRINFLARKKRNEGLSPEETAEQKKLYGEDLKKVILYGSYARGDFRDYSDIDIVNKNIKNIKK